MTGCMKCERDVYIASRNLCQPCYKKWLKETPKEDREKIDRSTWKPKNRTMSICHPNERDRGNGLCQACYIKDYRKKNLLKIKVKASEKHLNLKYGITEEQRREIDIKQGGKCALCFKPPHPGKRLHVDHNHSTGLVRGLLCPPCNWYMAKVDKDVQILDRMRNYREIS